jgi:UDPglucose--hexose-1-phosphate uridylyltransferase
MTDRPHRRFNPLRGEWVIVSAGRNARPWQGRLETPEPPQPPEYDANCYLCPGNERAHGARNPRYASTFAFDNDFPALVPDQLAANSEQLPANSEQLAPSPQPLAPSSEQPAPSPEPLAPADLLTARPERGLCRVLCFSPRHDLTLPRMETPEIRQVIDLWAEEYAAAAALPWVRYAMAFENRGTQMGASNPHPHGQFWATESVPNEPARERFAFDEYRAAHGRCLLCEYLQREAQQGERLVCGNDHFVALVPFWAMWPFETLVVARRHLAAIDALDTVERDALADVLKRLTTRYDNLFETPFPYSMGVHQQPMRDTGHDWHLHLHFYPPLLRSATIRKFMVGFEMLGSPQRDFSPEDAAARLQAVGDTHFQRRAGAEARR